MQKISEYFNFKGSVKRMPYFLGLIITLAMTLISLLLVSKIVSDKNVIGLSTLIIFIVSLWLQLSLAAKRCHDLNWPGIYSLVIFLPFGILYLLFAPTFDKSSNPSTGKKVFVFIFGVMLFLFLIGILAAVIIPVYQKYKTH